MASERQRCLQILGLTASASEEEIKKAYRRLALQYHPDKNDSEDAKAKFQQLSQAYQYLTSGQDSSNSAHWADTNADFFHQMFADMFFTQFMYRGGRGYFSPPSWFFMESEDDDDYFDYNDYYVSDSEEEGYYTYNYSQHYCNSPRHKDAHSFSTHVQQDPRISKKKQKKLEKRKRQRERQKERKEERRKENKQPQQNKCKETTAETPHTVNQELNTDEKKETPKSTEKLDQHKQDEQIEKEKQKKKQEAENRMREKEAKASVLEMLRKQKEKQEREREKQKEKERKAAEEPDSYATDWFYEDVSKSKKARQREKKRTAAANKDRNTNNSYGSEQPHEKDRSGKSEPVGENPLKNMDVNSHKGTRTKDKKMVQRKTITDKERQRGTTKLSTSSNTNGQSIFRNRFDVLDDIGDIESSFACDLNLESYSEHDSDELETNSESEIAEPDGKPCLAKNNEHQTKDCGKFSNTGEYLRKSHGSSNENQSNSKPRPNYSYPQRHSTDNQLKNRPSQNNGNYKAHRVFYNTRFKEERNKQDNIDSDLSDSTASSVSVKGHQKECNYPIRKEELSSPLNDSKDKKATGMGSVSGKSNAEKEDEVQSSQNFYSANKNVSNRPRTSSAQSYKVSSETYPGNKGENGIPVYKRNQCSNQKDKDFKGNHCDNQNNGKFQAYTGNSKSTHKSNVNDKEQGRFQKPKREFQACKGTFQSPSEKLQTSNRKFNTFDEVPQKPNRKFQHPERELRPSSLQSPRVNSKASDGKFQQGYSEFQSFERKFQTTSAKIQHPNRKCQMSSDNFQNSNPNFSSDKDAFHLNSERFKRHSNLQNNFNPSSGTSLPNYTQEQFWQQSSGFISSPRYDNRKPSHFYHCCPDGIPNSYAGSGEFQQYNENQRKSSSQGSLNGTKIYPVYSEGNECPSTGLYTDRARQFEKHEDRHSYVGSKYFTSTCGNNSDSLSSLESIDDTKLYSARRSSLDSVGSEPHDGPEFHSCNNTGVNMATLTNERLGIPESMFNNDYIRNYYK